MDVVLCVARPSSGLNPNKPILVSSLRPHVPDGHVLIEVDRFGFSANNITYQALGESPYYRYFDFFPAPVAGKVNPTTHGIVPVWGFGTVVESTRDGVSVGERVYGYFAPARYLLLPVDGVNRYSIFVARPHLPPQYRPYNTLRRYSSHTGADPSPLAEDLTMLYHPLFWTAFWCEDWLNESQYRGATGVLISSASAKTAFCVAYCIQKRNAASGSIKVVGLTSKRNVAFTKGLGLYDEVVDYDSLETTGSLQTKTDKWVYVDVAGDDRLNGRIHKHFTPQNNLLAATQVGLTTVTPSASSSTAAMSTPATVTNGLKMEMFFMPEWLAVRQKQLTLEQITGQQNKAWNEFLKDGKDWVRIERVYGGAAVVEAYKTVATKGTDPTSGLIWSLWDGPESGRGTQRPSKL